MEIATIISLIQVVVTNLPGAIKTVQDVYDLGTKFFAVGNGRAPTQAEKDQLRAQIDADVALALAPLPPPQIGDPDYKKSL